MNAASEKHRVNQPVSAAAPVRGPSSHTATDYTQPRGSIISPAHPRGAVRAPLPDFHSHLQFHRRTEETEGGDSECGERQS